MTIIVSYEIIMPKLGLTMTEGTVTKWLKAEGDKVYKGETLLEIETEKIANVVESPADGTLTRIIAKEGEIYEVSAVLGIITA